jgi:hypothetical protein
MALTDLQRRVCRLLAANRIASGESYVAVGAALNEVIGATRISRDVDLFHDTDEALDVSWHMDRALLEAEGLEVRVLRERTGLVEAEVDDEPGLGRRRQGSRVRSRRDPGRRRALEQILDG